MEVSFGNLRLFRYRVWRNFTTEFGEIMILFGNLRLFRSVICGNVKNRDKLLKTIQVNFDVNYCQFKETSFVAQMNAAHCIGGQNKRIIISTTKCQLVYKSSNTSFCCGLPMRLAHSSNPTKYIHELSRIVDFNCHELSLKFYP